MIDPALTRPGYATYPDTRPGDPTSPHRPVPDRLAPPLQVDCTDPARCTACSTEGYRLPPLRESERTAVAGGYRQAVEWPLEPDRPTAHLAVSVCPVPDSRPATPERVEPAGERFPAGLAEDEVLLLKLIARDRRRDRVRRLIRRLQGVLR